MSNREIFEESKKYMPGGVNSPVRAYRDMGIDPPVMKSGKGVIIKDEDGNEYAGADLQIYLNKMYYGGDTTLSCYDGPKNSIKVCPKDSKDNFLKLDETAKSLIDNYKWNINSIELDMKSNTLLFYSAERGTTSGKNCTGSYCNDTIIRTTEWTGYVALPYVTDWAYASGEAECETNLAKEDSSGKNLCKSNNWMSSDRYSWYLSPIANTSGAVGAWDVGDIGLANSEGVFVSRRFYPALYLKSDAKIMSGTGTSSDPYILKASA